MSQFGTDQNRVDAPKNSAAEILYSHREQIISKFLYRLTKELENARSEAKSILVNTLPNFIVNMAQALSPDDPRQLASAGSSISQEHGGERARLTNYSPEDVIREYQILREIIFQVIESDYTTTIEERRTINSSIDKAMTESMTAYFLVLNRLRERISLFVSSEIQKPLDAINGKALLIKKNPEKKEFIAQLAGSILTKVEEIYTMLHELNEPMPFKNSRKLRFELESADMHEIVAKTIERLNQRFGKRFEYKGVSVPGYFNTHALSRAIESLCTALLNYDSKDLVTVSLEQVHGRAVMIAHSDNKLIPVGQQEILFQAFRRDQRSKRKMNVGLPLARGVAEAHSGSLSADSSPEKGTTFMIDILSDSRPYQPSQISPGSELPGQQQSTDHNRPHTSH